MSSNWCLFNFWQKKKKREEDEEEEKKKQHSDKKKSEFSKQIYMWTVFPALNDASNCFMEPQNGLALAVSGKQGDTFSRD